MKLFYTPASPYARKARIIIHERGLSSAVEEIEVALRPPDPRLKTINPLGKIPALILDDGSVLFDSPVICEYLDEQSGGRFFPRHSFLKQATSKWRVLTLAALADGVMDATVRKFQELRVEEAKRQTDVIERQTAAIEAALPVFQNAVIKSGAAFTIAEISILSALGYLDVRFPSDGWRARYPQLAAWYAEIQKRPSVAATAAPPM